MLGDFLCNTNRRFDKLKGKIVSFPYHAVINSLSHIDKYTIYIDLEIHPIKYLLLIASKPLHPLQSEANPAIYGVKKQ